MFLQEDEVSQAAHGGMTSFRYEPFCLQGFPLKGALVR